MFRLAHPFIFRRVCSRIVLFHSVFYALIFVAISSCGPSPLLNHVNANDLQRLAQQPAAFTALNCDLPFSKVGLCASLAWLIQPDLKKKRGGVFAFRTWKGSEANTDGIFSDPGYSIHLDLSMKSMFQATESEISVEPKTDAIGNPLPGVFTSSTVSPILNGDWQIHVEMKQGDAVVDSSTLCCNFNGSLMSCPRECP